MMREQRYKGIVVYDGEVTACHPAGTAMTPEQTEQLAKNCDITATTLTLQGLHRQARLARKTAREWRAITARLLVQRRTQGREKRPCVD